MVTLVMGGFYGSEGKGSVVQWLAQHSLFDLAIRTGGPNAGHTIEVNGRRIAMRQLPCVWPWQDCPLYIPAAALIDPNVLASEIKLMAEMGRYNRVLINPRAAAIQPNAHEEEKIIGTGTTGEGIGATRAAKCMRRAIVASQLAEGVLENMVDGEELVQETLYDDKYKILVESTQGYGLSLESKRYPFVTSANITAYRILDDAEIPRKTHDTSVWMVLRAFPIRIAGNSGPLNGETTWEELRRKYGEHIPTEMTTVTRKVRRVGEWDAELAKEAIARNNPDAVVLTFADYVFPKLRDNPDAAEDQDVKEWIWDLEESMDRGIDYLGVGIGELIYLGEDYR